MQSLDLLYGYEERWRAGIDNDGMFGQFQALLQHLTIGEIVVKYRYFHIQLFLHIPRTTSL